MNPMNPGYNGNPFAQQGFGPQAQPPQGGFGSPPPGVGPAQPPAQQWGQPPAQQPPQPPQQQQWGQQAPTQPQTSSPQGWQPQPQQAPAQAPTQQWGGQPAGYAPQQGAQGFGPGAPARTAPQGNPLAGVTEAGGRLPMILQQGDFLLECLDNKILPQSNTLVFNFRIIESTNPNYAPGTEVQMIQKFDGNVGSWKWNIAASIILGWIRCLMGYADEASFRALPQSDEFVMSVIYGQSRPELKGRRARCSVSPTGKMDQKRQQPFMSNNFRVA